MKAYCKYCLKDIKDSKTRVVCDLCKHDKERRKRMEKNTLARLKRYFDREYKKSVAGKKNSHKNVESDGCTRISSMGDDDGCIGYKEGKSGWL